MKANKEGLNKSMIDRNTQAFCFIQTSSLDGEKNLKKKMTPKDLKTKVLEGPYPNLTGHCKCDLPNKDLYQFKGILDISPEDIPWDFNKPVPNEANRFTLTENQLLLKGAKLKNTQWITGIVVYTGNDTKLMQNQQSARYKYSKLEKEMNKSVLFLVIMHACICLFLAVATHMWSKSVGVHASYIEIDYEANSTGEDIIEAIKSFFTYYLVCSTFIPVSLYVTFEMAKLFQMYFITEDAEIFSETGDVKCKVNTASINEELGQVSYIFSDKTGTLT